MNSGGRADFNSIWEFVAFYPENVAIRAQATRWGSCSTRGTISLNFRLLFLEKREIDCLLLHEVCHLKHLNHGKRFWGLMEKHMAGAKERDRKLGEGWKRLLIVPHGDLPRHLTVC